MIALFLGILAAAGAQDDVDNPEYLDWKAFKSGAWVRFALITEGGGASSEGESVMRLLESGPQQVVLEMRLKMGGPAESRRLVLPARKPRKDVWKLQAKSLAQRDEALEVGGRKIDCRFEEWKQDADTIRLWTSPQVPGKLVKSMILPAGAPGTSQSTLAVDWGLEAPAAAASPQRLPAGFKLAPREAPLFLDAASGRCTYVLSADGKQSLVIDGVAGPAFQQVGQPCFSPAGRRVAYFGTDARTQVLVVDGKAGEAFPRSFSVQSGLGQIAFSPDGSKLAWVAPLKTNVAVYLDGRPGKECYSIRELRFTPDGMPTYLASSPEAPLQYVRIVGDREPAPASVDSIPGPDEKRVAHWVRTGRKAALSIDGKKGEDFETITSVTWSPDGSRVAYIGSNTSKNESFVILDGKKSEPWQGLNYTLVFSPDGKRLAYAASEPKSREWFIVVDQKRGPKCAPFNEAIVFSPDGRRLAYPQRGAGGSFMVVDGKKGPDSSELGIPRFSPDGKHVAYWTGKSLRDRLNSLIAEKRVMVLDGKPQEEFDAVSEPAFTPDGKELHYFGIRGQDILLKKELLR